MNFFHFYLILEEKSEQFLILFPRHYTVLLLRSFVNSIQTLHLLMNKIMTQNLSVSIYKFWDYLVHLKYH